MTEPSLWSFIINASPVVKLVLLILLMASLASWTIIIERVLFFKRQRREAKVFENHFWSGANLPNLYQEMHDDPQHQFGLSHIFYDGFKEFQRRMQGRQPKHLLDSTQRAMRIATTQEISTLEKHLGFLATVGSTSPYVGLFGTVWGIMTSFRALGTASQATIAMVAPGIAEALIATAIGLFAAIPAVIAYNRLSHHAESLATQYETFQEELTSVLDHQVNQTTDEEVMA